VLALAASLLLGILSGLSGDIYSLIRPVLVIFRSVPVISFILLSLIWFTNTSVPVFISFITMFPIICMNIIDGTRQIDRRYFELARMFRIGRVQRLRDVIIPAITPFLFSGIATAIGFGWRAVIIGEVLSQPEFGIGTRMQIAHIYLLIGPLIAWTVIAILISYLFDVMLRRTEKHVIKWR
jgi:NitT/TauT family transport system permease protein